MGSDRSVIEQIAELDCHFTVSAERFKNDIAVVFGDIEVCNTVDTGSSAVHEQIIDGDAAGDIHNSAFFVDKAGERSISTGTIDEGTAVGESMSIRKNKSGSVVGEQSGVLDIVERDIVNTVGDHH